MISNKIFKIKFATFEDEKFAIFSYVEWSSHQPNPTEDYNFDGHLNLFEFLETAQKNDLLVILRPGPFIGAERDMVMFILYICIQI